MQNYLKDLEQPVSGKLALFVLFFVTTIFLSGCEWLISDRVSETAVEDQGEAEAEEEVVEDPPEEEPEPEVSNDVVVTVTVLDETGLPLGEVVASSSIFQIESEQTNEFDQLLLTLVPEIESGTIVLSKPGYLSGLLYLAQGDYSQNKTVTLMRAGIPMIVDGATGGSFSAKDGATVEIEPEALMLANGTTAIGEIELYITPVDTSDENTLPAFPGSFLGVPDTLTSEVPIWTYGVVNMSFYQNGEKLQLRDGYTANLTLPIYAEKNVDGSDVAAGQFIPFWILNEETGVWEQNGQGQVVEAPLSPTEFALSVATDHFSYFNTDGWESSTQCPLTLDFIGVESQDTVDFQFTRSMPGFPAFIAGGAVNGPSVETRVPAGSEYEVWAQIVGLDGAATIEFECESGENIALVLDLRPDGLPVLTEWKVAVEPLFALTEDTEIYEINENRVTIGVNFYGDDDGLAIIESGFIDTATLLPMFAIDVEYYEMDVPSPTNISAELENENGITTETTTIEFISEHSPIEEGITIWRSGGTGAYYFGWDVLGADEVKIFLLGAIFDAGSIGDEYLGGPLEAVPSVIDGFYTNGLSEYSGYIRIEFTNQYGSTNVYRFISPTSEIDCPEFSELPECINPL